MTIKKGRFYKLLFFCISIFTLFMGIYMTGLAKADNEGEDTSIAYIEHWTVTDEAGNSFETGRTYSDERAYTEDFVMVSNLPDTIQPGAELCFMNRSDVSVYINGELRKDFKRDRDVGIPGGSLKEFYTRERN